LELVNAASGKRTEPRAPTRCLIKVLSRGPCLALAIAALTALLGWSSAIRGNEPNEVGRVTASAWLPPASYSLSFEDDLVALNGGQGKGCPTTLLNSVTLRVVRSTNTCAQSAAPGQIVVDFGTLGNEIRLEVEDPVTHRLHPGPVLLTLQNWDWNHSEVAKGNGVVWIYGLNGLGKHSELVEASATTGRALHRFAVEAAPDPYSFVDADGLWLTEGIWGGQFCPSACPLWHVAPGSGRLVAVRNLGVGTQWLVSFGHSIWADVLSGVPGGLTALKQTIWRLDGPRAQLVFEQPAHLLPSDIFGGTGYVVEGDPQLGFFTLSQDGPSGTPRAIGTCDTQVPMRVVRIDPTTGRQSYVAALPIGLAGTGLDCHLITSQGLVADGAFYFLADPTGPGDNQYSRVVRVQVGS